MNAQSTGIISPNASVQLERKAVVMKNKKFNFKQFAICVAVTVVLTKIVHVKSEHQQSLQKQSNHDSDTKFIKARTSEKVNHIHLNENDDTASKLNIGAPYYYQRNITNPTKTKSPTVELENARKDSSGIETTTEDSTPIPEESTTVPHTTNDPEGSTTSEDDKTVTTETTTEKPEDDTTVEDSTPIPEESTTVPQDTTNDPEGSTTSEDDTTVTIETTTKKPADDTTTPIPDTSTTITQDTTTDESSTVVTTTNIPEESTTLDDSTLSPGENSTAGPVSTSSTPVYDTTSSPIPSSSRSTTLEPSSSSSPETTTSSLPPFSCSTGYQYLPHPTNCHKYIHCSNGNELIMECPANLYWDYHKFVCSGDSGVCYNDDENANPEEKVCGPGVDFLAHPTDCTMYLQCSNGVALERKCPDPLYWNPEIKSCDWSNKYCTNLRASQSISCAAGMNFDVFQSDCSQYVKCFGSRGVVMSCNSGLYWNPVSQACEKSRRFCT